MQLPTLEKGGGGVKGARNETFPKRVVTLLGQHRLTRQSCFGAAPYNEKHVYGRRRAEGVLWLVV